ncbi:hypothetical protein FocTR4_00015702 [Fusarium oxysporum f. sp. cubense]|uniref:DUF7025 domain-containing protein n=1 Tax=Fusarium oxysporum f. sp. cubense TaxID=61366 RepID=A0A5C6SXG4_FUSOC|nr:hypothetical protein FocTR4_00015702 [Fusarium oxysporum f. sp. cubense]
MDTTSNSLSVLLLTVLIAIGILGSEEFTAKTIRPEESEEDEVRTKFDETVLQCSQRSVAAKTSQFHHLQQTNENEGEDCPVDSYIGWIAEIRHIHATKHYSGSGKRLYTTKVPISRGISQKLGEGQSQDEASTFAILDYHEESLRTSSIDIKNPALKKGLTDVLSNYPDVYTEAPVLLTRPPFIPFLAGTRTKYIEFDDLLVAVVPGELVVRYRIGLLWAGVFLAASIGEFWSSKSCDLKVRVMNWDGTCFGYREKTWEIRAFQGFRKITDLPVFPLDADSDRDQIEQRLVGRGRMFHRLCSQHVKVYTGVVHFKLEGRKMVGIWHSVKAKLISYWAHLSERIIVDAYAFYKFQYKYVPQLSDLNGEEGLEGPDPHSIVSNDYSSTQQSTFLTEEEYIIAIPYVRRFALKSMTWYKLDISNISHMMWNEKLLGNLVIQDQEKRLPLALVQDQGSHEDDKFDDFIEDKVSLITDAFKLRKGANSPSCGSPWSGQDSTAESGTSVYICFIQNLIIIIVTEELERPLYRVNAGILAVQLTQSNHR